MTEDTRWPRRPGSSTWWAYVDGEPALLFIDLHFVHEVTSPQAFDAPRLAVRPVRRPDLTLVTEVHDVPATLGPVADPVSRGQLETLKADCEEFGFVHNERGPLGHGIVHLIGPALGPTQPGMTKVCWDSHTSTLGALALGIGISGVEHVLATQPLPLAPLKTMAITVEGDLCAQARQGDIELIWKYLENAPGTEISVSLQERTNAAGDIHVGFQVDDYTAWWLLNGLDDISLTFRHEDDINAHEIRRSAYKPVVTAAAAANSGQFIPRMDTPL